MKVDQTSRWLQDVHRQLLRGKQVLLYGNIRDVFPYTGEYLPIQRLIDLYLEEEGYQLVGRYDSVDGITYSRPDEMRSVESQVVAGERVVVADSATANPGSGAPGRRMSRGVEPSQAQSGRVGHAPGEGGTPSQPLPPERAFPIIRRMVSQSQRPVAMTIQFIDKLVGDAQHQTAQDLPLLILLKKIVEESAIVSVGRLRNRRNALLLLAEELEGIPAWLYKNNPLLSLVHVPRPNFDERREFFADDWTPRLRIDNPEIDYSDVAEEFAALTDGLTSHDLQAIWRTSVLEAIPATQMKRLVDYYKFGQRDDPWENLDSDKIRNSTEVLSKRVIGQDHAISAVEQMLVSARVGLSLSPKGRSTKPKGVFFFVGPTGTGKTELAKALTELIFGDEAAFARFDMSEYSMEHASEKLTGSPPGFVGYGEGGQLTNRLLEKPFSLLLFDEIEKAHGKILDKFLQILEDGRLTDSRGQTADFSQSVIIFTSNIGSDVVMRELTERASTSQKLTTYPWISEQFLTSNIGSDIVMRELTERESESQELPTYPWISEQFLTAVRRYFSAPSPEGLGRPEILNRLGNSVLVFDILRPEFIAEIARKFVSTIVESTREQNGIDLRFERDEIPELICEMILKNPDALRMGGRQVKTTFESTVVDALSRFIFEKQVQRGAILRVFRCPESHSITVEIQGGT